MDTLKDLAERVGCSKYPPRWEELYATVMADFDNNGCVYTDPSYYEDINNRYGILGDELETYKQAAIAISKNEDLSRFLALLCAALQQREYHTDDMRQYSAPARSDGKRDIAYDMLPGLAITSQTDMCYDLLVKMGFDKWQIDYVLRIPQTGIMEFRNRHDGLPGFSFMEWYQIAIDAKLFRVGRLEIELPFKYNGNCMVFQDNNGNEVILAHKLKIHESGRCLGSLYCENPENARYLEVLESDAYWEGCPINDMGLVEMNTVRLDKNLWHITLQRGDPVINLHIPADGPLSAQALDDTFREIPEFVAKYMPDYKYKAIVCHSWLVDPQLIELLGEQANISKFVKRFRAVPKVSRGDGVFTWVYNKPTMECDWKQLPENTTLERKIKQHYLSGKAIYEVLGHTY